MNIKEIALKVANSLDSGYGLGDRATSNWPIAFAESIVAELAKENEHVGLATLGKAMLSMSFIEATIDNPNPLKLYTRPPTAEQIEQETAEAIASFVDSTAFYDTSKEIAEAIRSGAWKEYK